MSLNHTISILSDFWPPKPKFTANDVPDLSGKVMLITGGNAGIGSSICYGVPWSRWAGLAICGLIGKETAKVLLQHNAKVYITCRSAGKAKVAAEELKSVTSKTDDDLRVLSLDLSNLATIKEAVGEFLRYVPQTLSSGTSE